MCIPFLISKIFAKNIAIVDLSVLPRSAEMAALTRLATPPMKNPVIVINTAFVVMSLGESVISKYIQSILLNESPWD